MPPEAGGSVSGVGSPFAGGCQPGAEQPDAGTPREGEPPDGAPACEDQERARVLQQQHHHHSPPIQRGGQTADAGIR